MAYAEQHHPDAPYDLLAGLLNGKPQPRYFERRPTPNSTTPTILTTPIESVPYATNEPSWLATFAALLRRKSTNGQH